jgi:hypothetical protein
MRTVLVSYDLAQPYWNKHVLAQRIMALGTWARPLEQTWYVVTNHDAAEVERQLSHLLGDEDGLLVHEVVGDAALSNAHVRWFHHRCCDIGDADTTNVIPFRRPDTAVPPANGIPARRSRTV